MYSPRARVVGHATADGQRMAAAPRTTMCGGVVPVAGQDREAERPRTAEEVGRRAPRALAQGGKEGDDALAIGGGVLAARCPETTHGGRPEGGPPRRAPHALGRGIGPRPRTTTKVVAALRTRPRGGEKLLSLDDQKKGRHET